MNGSERIAEIKRLAATPDGAALMDLLSAEPAPSIGWTPGESSLPLPTSTTSIPDEQAQTQADAVAADLIANGFRPTIAASFLNLANALRAFRIGIGL